MILIFHHQKDTKVNTKGIEAGNGQKETVATVETLIQIVDISRLKALIDILTNTKETKIERENTKMMTMSKHIFILC